MGRQEIVDTSAKPMTPDEVRKARGCLDMTQAEFARAIGAKHRQHVGRAERELGLRGAQAKLARLLLQEMQSNQAQKTHDHT